MERRRLQGALAGLAEGLQKIGMAGMQRNLQGQTPMTGSGIKTGNVPQPKPDTATDSTDGGLLAPDRPLKEDHRDGEPGDTGGTHLPDYLIPSRPSTLAHESETEHPLVSLTRRRIDSGLGRRRI